MLRESRFSSAAAQSNEHERANDERVDKQPKRRHERRRVRRIKVFVWNEHLETRSRVEGTLCRRGAFQLLEFVAQWLRDWLDNERAIIALAVCIRVGSGVDARSSCRRRLESRQQPVDASPNGVALPARFWYYIGHTRARARKCKVLFTISEQTGVCVGVVQRAV